LLKKQAAGGRWESKALSFKGIGPNLILQQPEQSRLSIPVPVEIPEVSPPVFQRSQYGLRLGLSVHCSFFCGKRFHLGVLQFKCPAEFTS